MEFASVTVKLELVKKLGEDHDAAVKGWKHAIEVLGGSDLASLPGHEVECASQLEEPSDNSLSISTTGQNLQHHCTIMQCIAVLYMVLTCLNIGLQNR